MPLAVAQYFRHLATRCSRMSRDCHDPVVSKELVIISVDLVAKAEALEAHFTLPDSTTIQMRPKSSPLATMT